MAFWNWRIDELQLVPLLFLRGQEDEHEVGAGGELLALVADHEGVEVRPPLLDRSLQHGERIGAEGVHLGVELDEPTAVAQVDQAGPGVLLANGARLLERGQIDHARPRGERGDAGRSEDGGLPPSVS